jgi:hypothetical protein
VSADVLRERWKSDDERKARVVRLIVRGKAGHAQALIEAAVRGEQTQIGVQPQIGRQIVCRLQLIS